MSPLMKGIACMGALMVTAMMCLFYSVHSPSSARLATLPNTAREEVIALKTIGSAVHAHSPPLASSAAVDTNAAQEPKPKPKDGHEHSVPDENEVAFHTHAEAQVQAQAQAQAQGQAARADADSGRGAVDMRVKNAVTATDTDTATDTVAATDADADADADAENKATALIEQIRELKFSQKVAIETSSEAQLLVAQAQAHLRTHLKQMYGTGPIYVQMKLQLPEHLLKADHDGGSVQDHIRADVGGEDSGEHAFDEPKVPHPFGDNNVNRRNEVRLALRVDVELHNGYDRFEIVANHHSARDRCCARRFLDAVDVPRAGACGEHAEDTGATANVEHNGISEVHGVHVHSSGVSRSARIVEDHLALHSGSTVVRREATLALLVARLSACCIDPSPAERRTPIRGHLRSLHDLDVKPRKTGIVRVYRRLAVRLHAFSRCNCHHRAGERRWL